MCMMHSPIRRHVVLLLLLASVLLCHASSDHRADERLVRRQIKGVSIVEDKRLVKRHGSLRKVTEAKRDEDDRPDTLLDRRFGSLDSSGFDGPPGMASLDEATSAGEGTFISSKTPTTNSKPGKSTVSTTTTATTTIKKPGKPAVSTTTTTTTTNSEPGKVTVEHAETSSSSSVVIVNHPSGGQSAPQEHVQTITRPISSTQPSITYIRPTRIPPLRHIRWIWWHGKWWPFHWWQKGATWAIKGGRVWTESIHCFSDGRYSVCEVSSFFVKAEAHK